MYFQVFSFSCSRNCGKFYNLQLSLFLCSDNTTPRIQIQLPAKPPPLTAPSPALTLPSQSMSASVPPSAAQTEAQLRRAMPPPISQQRLLQGRPSLTFQPLQPMPRPSTNNNNYKQLRQIQSPRGLYPIPTFEETLSPTMAQYEAIERVLSAHSSSERGLSSLNV